MSIVYLNGEYLPRVDARVSVDDRGFLLSDGVYEVTPFYEGRPFRFEQHLARLKAGLDYLRISVELERVAEVHGELIRRNDLTGADRALVYLQITRGAAPRTHYFPIPSVRPTIYAYAAAWQRPDLATWERGYRAITVPDRRWSRVDIKTISLLPNVLAFQAAHDAGVDDPILVRDGIALEGAHQNFWAVFGDTVVTHPRTNLILPGVTRGLVLEIAEELGIRVEERPIAVEELTRADELFFTGTTGEVRPCVEVDGRPVGHGVVGRVTRQLSDGFLDRVEQVKRSAPAPMD